MLNLREMLVGDAIRLRYVQRFSTCHVVHRESVAEHSYYVALYAMFLADNVKMWSAENKFQKVNYERLYKMTLLHDLDEARTGDFYRPFKYSNPELKTALKAAAAQSLEEVLTPITDNAQSVLTYVHFWKQSKNDTLEGKIVAFADYLSVLSYMMAEIQVANITMREHWKTMNEYSQEFESADYDFLRECINQAKELLCEAFQLKGI